MRFFFTRRKRGVIALLCGGLSGIFGGVLSGCVTPQPRPYLPPIRGLIVPLYIYPAAEGSPGWEAWTAVAEVAAAARRHPELAVIVIANPANGLGRNHDPNYQRAIAQVRAAGATVVGYVALGYGAIDPAAVAREVRAWQRLYRGVRGIFFDEVPLPEGGAAAAPSPQDASPAAAAPRAAASGIRAYLRQLLAATRARGLAPLIGNPGVAVPADYFEPAMFDLVVVHEELHWPRQLAVTPTVGARAADRARRSAALIYGNNSWDEERFRTLAARIGFLFVNDHTLDLTGSGAYPWNYLPTNLQRQVELLAQIAPSALD